MNIFNEYLLNYYEDIKKNKLNKWYNDEIKKKEELGYLIRKFLHEHPRYNDIKYIQSGGAGNLVNTLNRIKTMFNEFNRIDTTKLRSDSSVVNAKIDAIIAKLKGVNVLPSDELKKLYNKDGILNNFDVMLATLGRISTGLKVDAERVSFTSPLPAKFNTASDTATVSQFGTLINQYSTDFKTYTNVSPQIADYNTKMTDLYSGLQALEGDVNQTVSILDGNYKKLNDFFESINKPAGNDYVISQYGITIDSREIIKIRKFNDIIALIKTKTLTDKYQRFSDTLDSISNRRKKIDYYNLMMPVLKNESGSIFSDNSIPEYYFDGTYTERIKNNLIKSINHITTGFDVLTHLINRPGVVGATHNDYRKVYAPDFKAMAAAAKAAAVARLNSVARGQLSRFQQRQSQQSQRSHPGGSLIQVGGNIEDEVEKLLTSINANIDILYSKISVYEKNVEEYNKNEYRTMFYTLYLVMIATNQLTVNNYIVYKYINKGVLQYLYRILEDIDTRINEGSQSPEIVYIRKYHYITVKILKPFIHDIVQTLNTSDIIDINACPSNIKNGFHLLNHFKEILEEYNSMFQNKITIYARINDWGGIENRPDEKVFQSDYDIISQTCVTGAIGPGTIGPGTIGPGTIGPGATGATCEKNLARLTINKDNCDAYMSTKPAEEPVEKHIYVTEVFDSKTYADNGIISNYMALQSRIAEGKHCALMTYGYSGVGKTFTLFGKSGSAGQPAIEGMLQSTLNSISGLLCLKFRIYELHGRGVAYPHYWQKGLNNIDQHINHYNVVAGSSSLKLPDEDITKTIEPSDFSTYTSNKGDYTGIAGDDVSKIFKNFDMFVDAVDNHRMKIGTIRETPNNPVSSRSMLVYDFILTIEDDSGNKKDVYFLIIDLPGREEIVETYVDTFMDRKITIKANELPEPTPIVGNVLQNILAAMAINPLALPMFYNREFPKKNQIPNIIINEYNNLELKERETIATTNFEDDFRVTYRGQITKTMGSDNNGPGVPLIDEGISFSNGSLFTLGHYFSLDADFKVVVDSDYSTIRNNYIKGDRVGNPRSHPGYANSSFQYDALISIHILNRIIQLNKFDILKNIFEKVVNVIINNNIKKVVNGLSDADRKLYIKKYTQKASKKTTSVELEAECYDACKYDYLLTPYEGVYINENIIGMIEYLSKRLVLDQSKQEKLVPKQDDNLNFKTQQQNIRRDIISGGYKDEHRRSHRGNTLYESFPGDPLQYNEYIRQEIYKEFKTTYKSDKIFNKKTPIIEDILEHYIKTVQIEDYKVFYLLSNTNKDLKCNHQIKLLNNTESFIKTIVKSVE
jgi:hypothetical protein